MAVPGLLLLTQEGLNVKVTNRETQDGARAASWETCLKP